MALMHLHLSDKPLIETSNTRAAAYTVDELAARCAIGIMIAAETGYCKQCPCISKASRYTFWYEGILLILHRFYCIISSFKLGVLDDPEMKQNLRFAYLLWRKTIFTVNFLIEYL